MVTYKLGAVETRFADIVWSNEPLSTRDLVELCSEELDWKRITTYSICLLYTSPSPRDQRGSRMPSSA